MEVSPNALRKDTVTTLKEVENQLDGIRGHELDRKATLLAAKATCLNTLVLLRDQEARLKR
jgi:hypothetical protein